ncbi:hypothetical protein CMV_023394 [Castanea mollissima]|uniref:Uncharacterized protein n=1 Tax=Castanea mollissima TaxID=60419 RepID=A0A8J4VAN8_9ROSI|nr:hypothetical protein CMV_023394 [Castanea mollissima]
MLKTNLVDASSDLRAVMLRSSPTEPVLAFDAVTSNFLACANFSLYIKAMASLVMVMKMRLGVLVMPSKVSFLQPLIF